MDGSAKWPPTANEKVPGVRITRVDDGSDVEVHVCARYVEGLVLRELATRNAAEVCVAGAFGQIDVIIDDVLVEQDAI
jgi:hypothetical protein